MAPALLGLVPFGFVAGVAAIGSGLTPIQGVALSVLSFSGIAQLVACQLIAVHSPVIVTVAAAAVVSLRFLMYSAALAPHLAPLDRRWRTLLAPDRKLFSRGRPAGSSNRADRVVERRRCGAFSDDVRIRR